MRDWLLTAACARPPWPPAGRGCPTSPACGTSLAGPGALELAHGRARSSRLAMLLVVYPGLPLNRATLAVAFAGTFAAGWVLGRRARRLPCEAGRPGSLRPATVPLAVAVAALAYGLLLAFRLGGVDSTDFVKAWGLKAAFAFQQHDLTFSGHAGPHLFYPLLVSNMNAAVYLTLGHVNDTVVRLPAGALRRRHSQARPGGSCDSGWRRSGQRSRCASPSTTPEFTTTMTSGLADLTTAAYLTPAALAAYLWVRGDGPDWAGLAGFMAGAAAWTKLEGAPSALVLLGTVLLIRRQLRTPGRDDLARVVRGVRDSVAGLHADPRHPAQPKPLREALPQLCAGSRGTWPGTLADPTTWGHLLAALRGDHRPRDPVLVAQRVAVPGRPRHPEPDPDGRGVRHPLPGRDLGERRGNGAAALPPPRSGDGRARGRRGDDGVERPTAGRGSRA